MFKIKSKVSEKETGYADRGDWATNVRQTTLGLGDARLWFTLANFGQKRSLVAEGILIASEHITPMSADVSVAYEPSRPRVLLRAEKASGEMVNTLHHTSTMGQKW
jgi:hypothetical protein